MNSSYQPVPQDADERYDSRLDSYRDEDEGYDGGYGYNYGSHYSGRAGESLKGKVEQKYWQTKQSMIQKLGKEQDTFVVAGDAEVDARLEAFRHIQFTCSEMLKAIEIYQNRIFALSQDENEMGRFLREQGSSDKSKAGKMMIAVGKTLSYSAQQRLSMRVPLVRLYQEIETFRYRAISDTLQTVHRMEGTRTQYRSSLLWMADISKELDPDEHRRLDKYREVQLQVKKSKKKFDKLKSDVTQKIDLLSASRCNLLSSTLASYQQTMLKFWENTTKNMQTVLEQFKGHPTYHFQMLKNLNPSEMIPNEPAEEIREEKLEDEAYIDKKIEEEDDDDDQLISLDHSPKHEKRASQNETESEAVKETDLLGDDNLLVEDQIHESSQSTSFDLLGDGLTTTTGSQPEMSSMSDLLGLETNGISRNGSAQPKGDSESRSVMSADDLLFGSPTKPADGGGVHETMSEIDLLDDIFGANGAVGKLESSERDTSFASTWKEMFGDSNRGEPLTLDPSAEAGGFMPSDLLEHMGNFDPFGGIDGSNGKKIQSRYPSSSMMPSAAGPIRSVNKGAPMTGGSYSGFLGGAMGGGVPSNLKASQDKNSKQPKDKSKKANSDLSSWFNLFSDLDPLANPDAIGKKNKERDEQRSC